MLESLLNSKSKRKVLSVFFAFPTRSYTMQELQKTAEVSARATSEAIRELLRADVVMMGTKNRLRLFRVNPRFPLYQELTDLLQDDIGDRKDLLTALLRKLSQTKQVILSGIFTLQPNLPVDLLIVGDHIGRLKLSKILAEVEKLTGSEVVYTVMPGAEYEYRRMMNDRFVRDILDYPHISISAKQKGKKR